MLLIDDDQAEIGVGQEQRRARADHDPHLAGRHRRPGARAQPRRELRMPFRRPHAEALGEAVEELRGERDLRHQDQRLPAAPDRFGHRLEIDLGLARAGDAVEQRDANSRRCATVARSASAAARCAGEKSGCAKSGSGARATGSGGSTSVSSVPSSISPSMTPADTPASCAASPLLRTRPSASSASTRRAPASCAAAADRRAARRPARAPGRDARPCAAPCAAPCRAAPACSPTPSRRTGAARPCSGGTSSLSSTSFMRLCRRGLGLRVLRPDHAGRLARAERHGHDVAGRERPCPAGTR